MTTEIERRINENHPESLKALAQEVRDVFAPAIDAMNVGITLLQDQFADSDKTFARLETVLKNLADTVDANKTEILGKLDVLTKRIDQIEIDQRELSQVIATLVDHLKEGKNGKPE